MIDVDGNYKGSVQEQCDDFWGVSTPKQVDSKESSGNSSQPSFYGCEVIRLVNEGGEKNLLKAKRYINLLIQIEQDRKSVV